jgi:hypothetical protein
VAKQRDGWPSRGKDGLVEGWVAKLIARPLYLWKHSGLEHMRKAVNREDKRSRR